MGLTRTGLRRSVVRASVLVDSELEIWLDQFADQAREAAIKYAEGRPKGEPLPDAAVLVRAMATAFDAAVDLTRMIDGLEATAVTGKPTGPRE